MIRDKKGMVFWETLAVTALRQLRTQAALTNDMELAKDDI
jgi:nitric oxide synthase oxygenase domain/subunit